MSWSNTAMRGSGMVVPLRMYNLSTGSGTLVCCIALARMVVNLWSIHCSPDELGNDKSKRATSPTCYLKANTQPPAPTPNPAPTPIHPIWVTLCRKQDSHLIKSPTCSSPNRWQGRGLYGGCAGGDGWLILRGVSGHNTETRKASTSWGETWWEF